MQADDNFPEDTADVKGARKALAESRQRSKATDRLVDDARATFAEARAMRESNHFADKFRAIIRGAA